MKLFCCVIHKQVVEQTIEGEQLKAHADSAIKQFSYSGPAGSLKYNGIFVHTLWWDE